MRPGDLVQLPDGRVGYYQRKEGSEVVVLVYETVPARDVKKVKP